MIFVESAVKESYFQISISLNNCLFQVCIIVVDRIDIDDNPTVGSFTASVYNNYVNDTLMNFTLVAQVDIVKMKVAVEVNLPQDQYDQAYQRNLYRASIDVEKILDGAFGSFVFKIFMENFKNTIDFEPKLPFKKVRSAFYCSNEYSQ